MNSLCAAAVLVCFVPTVPAADVENPFQKAHVGDWVEYRMTGPNMEGKTKMTVVAKDDKAVAYEVAATFSFAGREMVAPVQKLRIDLTKPYDPIVAANLQRTGVKFEKSGEGQGTVVAGGKQFDAKWTQWKASTTTNGMTVVTDYKLWLSKDVPLSGMVRMITTTSGITTNVELIGSGGK
jgi:hypothetical protein